MGRHPDIARRQKIEETFDQMYLSEGRRPSIRRLQAHLGWGSKTLIGLIIGSRPPPLVIHQTTEDGAQITRLAAEVANLKSRLEAADDRAEGLRKHLLLETERVRQEIEQRNEGSEAARLRRRVQVLEGEIMLRDAREARDAKPSGVHTLKVAPPPPDPDEPY